MVLWECMAAGTRLEREPWSRRRTTSLAQQSVIATGLSRVRSKGCDCGSPISEMMYQKYTENWDFIVQAVCYVRGVSPMLVYRVADWLYTYGRNSYRYM